MEKNENNQTFINSKHTRTNIEKKTRLAFLRGITLTSFIINITLLITVIILAKMPKTEIPYVIEISRDGEASLIKDAAVIYETWEPSKTTIMQTLKTYIVALRSVPKDNFISKENIKKVYALSSGDAADYITSYYSTSSPLTLSESIYRRVNVYAAIPMIDKSNLYQIDWNEKDYSLSGTLKEERNYRGIFKIQHYKPQTSELQELNPLGLYVSDIEISPIQNGSVIYE